MLKRAFIIFALTMLSLRGIAQDTGIHFFQGSWPEVLGKARKEHKMIFLDCYAVWCGPCALMAKTIFTQPQVGEHFNKNYISYKVDMEKETGRSLKEELGVTAYPTLIILNSNGYKIKQFIGSTSADTLIFWASGQLNGSITLAEKIDQGDRSPDALLAYFKGLTDNGQFLKARSKFHEILKTEKKDALLDQKYWDLLPLADMHSAEAAYLIQNQEKFIKRYGKDVVSNRIAAMFSNPVHLDSLIYPAPMRKINQEKYQDYVKMLMQIQLKDREKIMSVVDFYIACKINHMQEAHNLAENPSGGETDWQRYRMIKLAAIMIYNVQVRKQWSDWAQKAANEIRNPTLKSAGQLYASSLTEPFKEDMTHRHLEAPDYGL